MRRTRNLWTCGWFVLAAAVLLARQTTLFAEDWTCPHCGRPFQFDSRDSDFRSQWVSLHLSVCGGGSFNRARPSPGPSKNDLDVKDLKEASDDANDKGAEF